MEGKLKSLGGIILVVAVVIAMLAVPVIFFYGVVWATRHLLGPLMVAGWIALALDLLVLLPLSIFKRLRGFTGLVIFISSYVFGLITWLLSVVLTWALWGGWAVVVGILLFGGAVVPFALLATLFKAMWEPFFSVLILFILTFGSRIAGVAIAEARDK